MSNKTKQQKNNKSKDVKKILEKFKEHFPKRELYYELKGYCEGDVLLPVKQSQLVVVYGVSQSGKSAFLLSLSGVLLLRRDDVRITYFDLEGKDCERAEIIKNIKPSNFTYIPLSEEDISCEDLLIYIRESSDDVFMIDAYNRIFKKNDPKYDDFLNELRNIVLKDQKTIFFSSQTYKFNSTYYPYGGLTAIYPTDRSIFIKKSRRSKMKRTLSETRYALERPSELKLYKGHVFFDFFVDEVVGSGSERE